MLVHHLLQRSADKAPDSPALLFDEGRISYRELDRRSDRLAAALQTLGVRRGDRVAAMLDNSPEFVTTLWAVLKAGAVFIPVNRAAKGTSLGYILADAEVSCLVVQPGFAPRVREATDQFPAGMKVIWTGASSSDEGDLRFDDMLTGTDTSPADPHLIDQDLSLIIYTSGSTGTPKGVMLTHHAVANNAEMICAYLEATAEDVVLGVLPMCFSYGLFQVITAAQAGFSIVVHPSLSLPADVLKQISRHRVTGLPAVPALIIRLLEFAPFADFEVSQLRYITNAAAPLPPAHVARLRRELPGTRLFSMYGLTECTRVCYMDPAKLDAKTASVGRAMANCEALILDETGARCQPGEVGELVVRGSNLMRGYWRLPAETAKALRVDPQTGDRLLYTGDLFTADEDGDLFFVGRRDDVFKCRGEKVSPRLVENVLHECEDVAEAAIIGVADPIDGMAVHAYVVLGEGRETTPEALRRYCMRRLETWLVPKQVFICDTLPKTESGKVTRKALREQAGA